MIALLLMLAFSLLTVLVSFKIVFNSTSISANYKIIIIIIIIVSYYYILFILISQSTSTSSASSSKSLFVRDAITT